MKYNKIVCEGYNLHLIHTEKFKNIRVNIRMSEELSKEKATKRALLTLMLMCGSSMYPTQKDISKRMQELYGGSLGTSINSVGLISVLGFKLGVVSDKFLSEPILEDALEVLKDKVFNPVFKEDDLRIQKEELRQRITSIYDNKALYSIKKLVEIIGKGKPYSVEVNGYIDEIDTITTSDLEEEYQNILKTNNIDIFVIGSIDDKVTNIMKEKFKFDSSHKHIECTYREKADSEFEEVFEVQSVNQGKLNIAYVNNTTVLDEDYYSAVLFNTIFGGMSNSKLFMNVREKHSLAYTVYSRYDGMLGLNLVHCGINNDKLEKATSIIDEQLLEMQNGNITDFELEIAKTTIKNQVLQSIDTPSGAINFHFSKIVTSQEHDVEKFLDKINEVTKEQVIEFSKKVKKDKQYFLHGGEIDGNN